MSKICRQFLFFLFVSLLLNCKSTLNELHGQSADTDEVAFFFDPNQELYFHWGSKQGNRVLLENSGYVFPKEGSTAKEELATSVPLAQATIDERVRAYQDAGGGSTSMAGPGIYISREMNTAGYGSDLMLVEIIDRNSIPLQTEIFDTNTLVRIAEGLKNGPEAERPPVVARYTWTFSVVARAPGPEDKIGVHLSLPGDIQLQKFWNYRLAKSTKIQMLNLISSFSLILNKEMTPPAKAFINGLVFTYGIPYLLTLDPKKISPSSREFFMKTIMASQLAIPDERLLMEYVRKGFIYSSMLGKFSDFSVAERQVIAATWHLLDQETKAEFFERIVDGFNEEYVSNSLKGAVNYASGIKDDLTKLGNSTALLSAIRSRIIAKKNIDALKIFTSADFEAVQVLFPDLIYSEMDRDIIQIQNYDVLKRLDALTSKYVAKDKGTAQDFIRKILQYWWVGGSDDDRSQFFQALTFCFANKLTDVSRQVAEESLATELKIYPEIKTKLGAPVAFYMKSAAKITKWLAVIEHVHPDKLEYIDFVRKMRMSVAPDNQGNFVGNDWDGVRTKMDSEIR